MKIENTNLRLADGLYAPVGKPFIHTSLKGATPLGHLSGKILCHKESELFYGTESVDAGSEILCATVINENKAILMTADGPAEAIVSNGKLTVSRQETPPAVRLIATSGSPVTATVDKRTLSSDLTERHLKESDAKALIEDLCGAYRQLCETAAGSGAALQPALARYKLIDKDGRCVFTSPTLFLSHSSATQCSEYIELYRHEGNTLQGYTLEARPWHLDIVLPAEARDDIKRLDVTMTPLFHPYDTTMNANVFMVLRTGTGDPIARISLPGVSRSTSENFGQCIVREAFARMDELEKPVISIHNPFNGTERTVRAALAASTDPMADTKAISHALTKSVAPSDRIASLLSAPNRFSAAIVADSGSTLMWSGINTHRAPSCSPEIFAAGKGETVTWGATVAVRFHGNKGVSKTYMSGSGGFHTLGAILSYPAADAEEIGISVNCGGKFYNGTFPLSTDSSGRYALYMSPKLKSIELVEDKNPLFFNYDDASENLEGYAVFTGRNLPLETKGYCNMGAKCVGAVNRKALNQAWDFGRSRFIAATTDAILSLAVARNGEVSVNKLSEKGILRTDAMIAADNGNICLLQDGIIHILKNTGGLERLETEGEHKYQALAWNGVFAELWALTDDDGCIVSGKGYSYHRNDISPSSFVNAGGESFGICPEGIAELAEEEAGSCRITHIRDFDITGYAASIRKGDRQPANIRSLILNMQGASVDGRADISAISLDGKREFLIRTIYLSGSCTAPVRIPLITRLFKRLRISFSALVSEDFRLAAD